MAKKNVSAMNMLSVIGSYFYFYFKACFFAGLFWRSEKMSLSDV